VDDVVGGDDGLACGVLGDGAAGVGVAVVAGEGAAGDLEADPVTGQEDVGGYGQVQDDLVDLPGFEQFGFGQGVAVSGRRGRLPRPAR
jgi:hypothetical protein